MCSILSLGPGDFNGVSCSTLSARADRFGRVPEDVRLCDDSGVTCVCSLLGVLAAELSFRLQSGQSVNVLETRWEISIRDVAMNKKASMFFWIPSMW